MRTLNTIQKDLLFKTLALSMIVLQNHGKANPVFQAPAEKYSLKDKLAWAEIEMNIERESAGIWIGYRIEKWMNPCSNIGGNGSSGKYCFSLQDILDGKLQKQTKPDQEETLLKAAQKALANQQGQYNHKEKVLKPIAILFRYKPGQNRIQDFQETIVTNMDQQVNLHDLPLIWLGTVRDEESLDLLHELYSGQSDMESQKGLILAIAIHESKPKVISILGHLLGKELNVNLRGEAAFWLGQQDHANALNYLKQCVHEDKSEKVKEKAVFAISQMELDAATDLLIDLAYHGKPQKVQKEAIFWLGQKASKRISETLSDIAFDFNDTEIQKQAVFALSQLPCSQSIPELVRISKNHSNPVIRKSAIFWLGESGDPKAIDALVEIVQQIQR